MLASVREALKKQADAMAILWFFNQKDEPTETVFFVYGERDLGVGGLTGKRIKVSIKLETFNPTTTPSHPGMIKRDRPPTKRKGWK